MYTIQYGSVHRSHLEAIDPCVHVLRHLDGCKKCSMRLSDKGRLEFPLWSSIVKATIALVKTTCPLDRNNFANNCWDDSSELKVIAYQNQLAALEKQSFTSQLSVPWIIPRSQLWLHIRIGESMANISEWKPFLLDFKWELQVS